MPSIAWLGSAPTAAERRALAAVSLTLHAQAPIRVLRSARVRTSATLEGPWIWLVDACPDGAAREAIRSGCYDVIPARDGRWPERLAKRVAELDAPQPPIPDAPGFVARSRAARAALAQIAQVARTSMPVLLVGETGTGKEVAARLIHAWSARRAGLFVPVNCAAIPNELMEGELFGYAKGAFSGAVRRYDGQLMAAQDGTVFLDEVDDTPKPLQVKLLRVLEDRVVTRLGESEPHQVDFRILAATNRDLKRLISTDAFGGDLYERLAICSIALPPLRERLEDLPALTEHLIDRFYRDEPAAKLRGRVRSVRSEVFAAFEAYPWPGNIRELRNALFSMLVAKRAGDELLLADLPDRILRGADSPQSARASLFDEEAIARRVAAGGFNLRQEVEQLERCALTAALAHAKGNASAAARQLGEVGRGGSRAPGGTVRAMTRRLGLSSLVGRRAT